MAPTKPTRVLIIGGSDSGGGAGIQADIKAVTVLGGFAMTAITALTAQNTQGVHGVIGIDPAFIRRQIDVVLTDIGADAIKIGMLHSVPVIEAVTDALRALALDVPVVLDPVMMAKGGAPLLAPDAIDAVRTLTLPLATVITPNLPEAAALLAIEAATVAADPAGAGTQLRALGAQAALVKGGHADGPIVRDVLVTDVDAHSFERPRIDTRATHGTGCTLASAFATGIGQRLALVPACERAINYVHQAIQDAPGLGAGHGPLGHNARVQWTG
jgi:hydroxymethylpyrimidine/phosphomethylpyrimidine kinase